MPSRFWWTLLALALIVVLSSACSHDEGDDACFNEADGTWSAPHSQSGSKWFKKLIRKVSKFTKKIANKLDKHSHSDDWQGIDSHVGDSDFAPQLPDTWVVQLLEYSDKLRTALDKATIRSRQAGNANGQNDKIGKLAGKAAALFSLFGHGQEAHDAIDGSATLIQAVDNLQSFHDKFEERARSQSCSGAVTDSTQELAQLPSATLLSHAVNSSSTLQLSSNKGMSPDMICTQRKDGSFRFVSSNSKDKAKYLRIFRRKNGKIVTDMKGTGGKWTKFAVSESASGDLVVKGLASGMWLSVTKKGQFAAHDAEQGLGVVSASVAQQVAWEEEAMRETITASRGTREERGEREGWGRQQKVTAKAEPQRESATSQEVESVQLMGRIIRLISKKLQILEKKNSQCQQDVNSQFVQLSKQLKSHQKMHAEQEAHNTALTEKVASLERVGGSAIGAIEREVNQLLKKKQVDEAAAACLSQKSNAWCQATSRCRDLESLAFESPEKCSGAGWTFAPTDKHRFKPNKRVDNDWEWLRATIHYLQFCVIMMTIVILLAALLRSNKSARQTGSAQRPEPQAELPQGAVVNAQRDSTVVNAVPLPQAAVIANISEADRVSKDSADSALQKTAPSTEDEVSDLLRSIRSGSSVHRLQLMGLGPVDVIERALLVADGDLSAAAVALVELQPECKTEPESEAVWEDEWDSLLDELQEMGFDDNAANKGVVQASSGNLKGAVQKLVQEEREKANVKVSSE